MALRIEDEETERLVARLAHEAGESKTATVRQAMLREWQRRENQRRRRRRAEMRRILDAGV
jgi:hypothetical protein